MQIKRNGAIFLQQQNGQIFNERGVLMSSIAPNSGLILPDVNDEIHQTILDLAINFQKIDNVSDIYVNDAPTSGDWAKNRRVYFNNPETKGYVGMINLRAGKAAPKWSSLRQYSVGDKVVPTTDNGHWYECIQSGYSAPTEPNWLVAAQTITEDTRGKTTWQPSKYYDIHDIVVPSIPNDRFYVCVTAGTSGTSEPTWSTTDGVSTVDGQVVWLTYRIVKWRESGTSAYFRPFGKID
jgi:hypothetical protein